MGAHLSERNALVKHSVNFLTGPSFELGNEEKAGDRRDGGHPAEYEPDFASQILVNVSVYDGELESI